MKIVVASNGYALMPRDEHSAEIIRGMSRSVDATCEIKQPRNVRQLRFIYAMLKKIADNHPDLQTVEAVKRELKIRSKMFDPFVSANGKLYYALRSTSFETMDQAEFSQVWDDWRRIICTDLLPGLSSEGLANEILETL